MDVVNNFRKSVLDISAYSVSGHPAKIKLNQNESPFDIPDELKRKIIEEFVRIYWNRYPDVFSKILPERFAQMYDLPVDSFIASNGSNELIYTVEMAIVEQGRKVLIPQPTFYLFEKVARILGGDVRKLYAGPSLKFDEEEILRTAKSISSGLVILGSPNNPTGQSVSDGFIAELLKSTAAMVLVDEAYIEFSPRESVIGLTRNAKNLIVLRTLSKAYSLAGLRVGYLVTHPDTAYQVLKVKIPFTVNPLSEFTAMKLLEDKRLFAERVDFLKRQRVIMADALREISGVNVVDSDANFFLFSTPVPATKLFEQLLEKKSVLIRDVTSYPMLDNYLRVNVGSEEESRYFVESVKSCLGKL